VSSVTTQPGIFALGTPEHCYLELDLEPGRTAEELVRGVAGLTGPLSSTGGVNVVVGFRPELWASVAPADAPADAAGFTEDVVGAGRYRMPATQHDAWVWVAGGDRTAVFDNSRAVLAALKGVATVGAEVTGWLYRHDRDLTGFIDGTENPSLLTAPAVALVPAGQPGAGSSARPGPGDLHRNTATGTLSAHGTAFAGFSAEQGRLAEMLRRMAGLGDGIRDALTRYTRPVTGAYYTVPSVDALSRFAPTRRSTSGT
jgi:porphyrinogen peroxidase